MINKKQFKINNNFQKNELIGFMSNKTKNNNNFSNINLFVPKRNNYLSETFENKTNENNFSKFASNSKKYYVSCIDGKAIVNGVRKDIPFYFKLANNDNKINNNNTYTPTMILNSCVAGVWRSRHNILVSTLWVRLGSIIM